MATAEPGVSPTTPAQPSRILLVDDNAPGRRALAKVLETLGYDVVSVGTGQEALAAFAQPPTPQVLLTDLVLPDLDGLEVAQAARKLTPPPYTILITGWSLDPNTQDPTRYGVDEVFLKPIKIDELTAKLSQICHAIG